MKGLSTMLDTAGSGGIDVRTVVLIILGVIVVSCIIGLLATRPKDGGKTRKGTGGSGTSAAVGGAGRTGGTGTAAGGASGLKISGKTRSEVKPESGSKAAAPAADDLTDDIYEYPTDVGNVICPNCGVEHRPTDRICSVCGATLR